MKHILFQLITGHTIGSLVIFKGDYYKILDINMISPFNRSGLFKPSFKRPLYFIVQIKSILNRNNIQIVGNKALKSKFSFDNSMSYAKYKEALKNY